MESLALGVAFIAADRAHDIPNKGVAEHCDDRQANAEGNRLRVLGAASGFILELVANESRNISHQSRRIDALRSPGIGFAHGPPGDQPGQSLGVHGVSQALKEFDARILGLLALQHCGDIVAQRVNRSGVQRLNQAVSATEMVQDRRVGDSHVPVDFLEPDGLRAALGQEPLGGVQNLFSRNLGTAPPARTRCPPGVFVL